MSSGPRSFHEHRPHQSQGNKPIRATGDAPAPGEVCCESRLGGLLKHYYRKAA